MSSKKITILLLSLILSGCTPKTYTITFDTTGGEVMKSITLKEGATIKNIAPPQKEGYLFVNWQKDGLEYDINAPIKEDLTLTATWIETPEILDTYTVTYMIDGVAEHTKVKENDIIKEPKHPTKENYLFLGWYVGEEKYDFNNKITKDIILTAKYKLDEITITYDLDGGIGTTQESILRNTTLSIPEPPKKDGYKFVKWVINDNDFSFTTKLSKDTTIKAIWEKIEYIMIKFDTDGGNQLEPIIIEKYSKLPELEIPEKDGYIFKEWQLNDKKFNNDTIIENDITLKAIYEIDLKKE